jgi:hypothetical protein
LPRRLPMDRVEYQLLVIQDLINLHRQDELDLNPWYQRRSVWTTPQKAYLVNTILEQKPVPSLYIRHSLDLERERSIKEVVDGQQRIRSILEYVDDEFPALHPAHGRKAEYSELTRHEKEAFLMTSLSVGFLMGATDADVIEIFGRLNSVSKTLNPQEKRNARYSGDFKQFCLQEAARRVQLWRDLGVFTANDIARMQEVQFVSELALNMMSGLSDYSAKQIDDTYAKYDDLFDTQRDIENRMERVFALIGSLDVPAVRDTIFSRAPIFFTLFLVLDSTPKALPPRLLQDRMHAIDKSYSSDLPIRERGKEDAEFYVACTSNMHRIKSRRIREAYVRARLAA